MRKGEAADKPVENRPLDMELLERLKSRAPGWLKLEELAGREGVAGEEVESALEALEGFGFQFEHHPYTGIRYVGPAERLCPDQMEWKLATKLVGRRISVWNRVVSTNDLGTRAARPTVVCAAEVVDPLFGAVVSEPGLPRGAAADLAGSGGDGRDDRA